MTLPPNARAEGLTRMGPICLKGRGLISRNRRPARFGLHRSDLVRDEGADVRIVGDGEGTLESLRLVRKIVASRHGDEFAHAFGGRRPLARDLEEIVPSEVDLLRVDRLELHVIVPPAFFLVFHAITLTASDVPAARDGGPRNGPVDMNLLGRPRCESSQPRSCTAPLNSAGSSCALGCSALAAAPFSRVVSVLGAARRRWRCPRPRWAGRAPAAAPSSVEISVPAVAFRRPRGATGRLRPRPEAGPSSPCSGPSRW